MITLCMHQKLFLHYFANITLPCICSLMVQMQRYYVNPIADVLFPKLIASYCTVLKLQCVCNIIMQL